MIKMNSKLISCVLFFSLIAVSNLCASDKSAFIEAGISTGIPVYGDKEIRALNSKYSDDGHRVIIGSVVNVNVRISQNLFFFLGNDSTFDFCWNKNNHSNHFETAFYPGLKAYPGFGGLNFSCAYTVGIRKDFVPSENDLDKSFWGNGFRLGLEYDFSKNTDSMFPALGAYYRFCPRGSYHYDNIISLYVVMPF